MGSDRHATLRPVTAAQLTIVPANEASWADLQAIFGTADYPGRCYCQRFKTRGWFWTETTDEERRRRFRDQANCGDPAASSTTGLVAYLGSQPVGWVAVEPRIDYPRLTQPGKEITWGELHVGSRQVFADADFTEVSRPSPRRVVLRIDFTN
jgi:hypothetical protein